MNLRNLRETLGFLLCRLIEYSCVYSPADSADYAEECSKLHYIAEKDSFVASGGWGVMCFWVLSAIICVICERIGRSHIRKEQGKSKERARNEQGINEHVSSQLCCINMNSIVFTMRQLSFVCEIMQLAAFPLRNLRDLRET